MLSVSLICLGKMKEKHYIAALEEYEKRLRPYCRLEITQLPESRLPDSPSQSEIKAALEKEAAEIRSKIPSGAYTVAMCIEGSPLSSAELSELMSGCASRGFSRLCFIIGSSNGLSEELKKGADFRLSMSKMTFPHHLARVMLAEQIYRGIMISEGTRYHK